MKRFWLSVWRDESGVAATEYLLMVAMFVGLIGAAQALSAFVTLYFQAAAKAIAEHVWNGSL